MPLTRDQRKQHVTFLTSNCECWKHEGDAEILNSLPDEKLQALKDDADRVLQAVAVANAAVRGTVDNGFAYRVNPVTGTWERKSTTNDSKNPLYDDKPKEKKNPFDNMDMEEDEEEMSDEEYGKMMKNRMRGKKTRNRKDQEGGPPDKSDSDTKNNQSLIRKPRTADEWYNAAPESVQNEFRFAQQITKKRTDELVRDILTNSGIAESERAAHREWLAKKPLDELANMLALIPKPPTDQSHESQGNGRAVALNRFSQRRRKEEEDTDTLELPTMNWGTEEQTANGNGKSKNESRNGSQTHGSESSEQDYTDDEVLNALPPNVRSTVLNARAIEERERRKLIEEITANVTDEDAEQRLLGRLRNKSLDELKDYLALAQTAKKESPKPNYFGQGASSLFSGLRANADSGDDGLPLPTMNWSEKGD